MTEEFVPNDRAMWQEDGALLYRCVFCKRSVFTRITDVGASVTITCQPNGHRVQWFVPPDARLIRA